MRTEFSAKVKVEAFKRAGKRCEQCTAPLFPGNIEYDHRLPDQLGGSATLDNCVVLCRACHRIKTGKSDVPAIAKAKRREREAINARPPSKRPLPGSRASGIRKRMSGAVERWPG